MKDVMIVKEGEILNIVIYWDGCVYVEVSVKLIFDDVLKVFVVV